VISLYFLYNFVFCAAKAPNRMDSLKRDVIRTEIDRQRAKRVQLTASLPAVNRNSIAEITAK
jgi:hypothetical protein